MTKDFEVIVPPAAEVFATAITTDAVLTSNAQTVRFLILTGDSDAAETVTLTVQGKLGASGTAANIYYKLTDLSDGTSETVNTKSLSIGEEAAYMVEVKSAEAYDRVLLKTTASASSEIEGSIVVMLDNKVFEE